MKHVILRCLAFLLAGWALCAHGQTIRYVSTTGGNISPFTNWAMASVSISNAVAVSSNGETILVADGHYPLTAPITVVKGIILRGTNVVTRNVRIDGAGSVRCFNISHSNALIAFMTISNGFRSDWGGGALILTAGTMSNCTIVGNRVIGTNAAGGGVVLNGGGLLVGCRVSGNQVSTNNPLGGGVYCYNGGQLKGCEIVYNTAYPLLLNAGGSGVYFYQGGSMESCTTRWNRTSGSGGGVAFYAGGLVRSSYIVANTASNRGGGIECYLGGTVERSLISSNVALNAGGGIDCFWSNKISGCILYSNSAQQGGGVFCNYGGALTNCTIYNNHAAEGGGIYMAGFNAVDTPRGELLNCLVYSNSSENYYFTNSFSQKLNYCLTTPDSALFNGTGNLTNAPWFFAPGSYRLAAGSPGIDQGSPAEGAPLTEDSLQGLPCDGNFDGLTAYDIGAYEFSTNRDTDADGMPDGWEYRYWLNPTSAPPAGDDDGDFVLNQAEFTTNANPRNDISGTELYDNIPVGWRQKYFPTNSFISSLEDPDGDGQNNWQESIAGTHPTNGQSYFTFTTEVIANEQVVRFSWSGMPDRFYQVDEGSHLSEPLDFMAITNYFSPTPYPTTHQVELPRTNRVIFYRLGVSYP